jgi:hypothetical protein
MWILEVATCDLLPANLVSSFLILDGEREFVLDVQTSFHQLHQSIATT